MFSVGVTFTYNDIININMHSNILSIDKRRIVILPHRTHRTFNSIMMEVVIHTNAVVVKNGNFASVTEARLIVFVCVMCCLVEIRMRKVESHSLEVFRFGK